MKKKYLAFLFCLIISYGLFQNVSVAQSESEIGIVSKGRIEYLSSNSNLADIPDDWHITFDAGPQIIAIDYAVVRTVGKPSIRLDPHVEGVDQNHGREVNGKWYDVKGGDHVIARCWILTEHSTLEEGNPNPYSGARIGFDFYGDHTLPKNGYLTGIAASTYPQTAQSILANYVHWGTSEWTLRTMEFDVPETVVSELDGRSYPVKSIVFWMQGWSSTYGASDPARAYFADAELYIHPSQ